MRVAQQRRALGLPVQLNPAPRPPMPPGTRPLAVSGDAAAETNVTARLAVGMGLVALLGITGYYWGRSVAPSKKAQDTYGTAGAVSNIAFPVVGPTILTLIGAAKS